MSDRPKAGLKRRHFLQLSGVVALAYGATLVLRRTAPLGQDVSANPTARALQQAPGAPMEGPDDADVTIIAFTDYQCPACKKAAPALRAAALADGAVRIAYKDWPIFGAISEYAARVALAAHPQGIYPALHHALMAEPARLDPPVLRRVVQRLGGDWLRIERELEHFSRGFDLALEQIRSEAFLLGLPGTPAFLIGDRLVIGALSEAEFRRAFALARE